jgi:hypothetical protein
MMDKDKSFNLIVFESKVATVISHNHMVPNRLPLTTSLVKVLVDESVETKGFFADSSAKT